MRKIDLTNYEVDVTNGLEVKKMPYPVKQNLIAFMFGEHMKHTSQALIEYSDIKEKIKKADDSILLEAVEYNKLLQAVDTFQGYREIDLEFVKRIKNAPEVEVAEKK